MEKNHENNEMTLEKLATLTQKGFIELEEKLEEKLIPIKDELKDFVEVKIKDFQDKLSKDMDHIYGVLKDIKEENTLGFAEYKRHDEKLINHESRIVSLESK